MLTHPPLSRRPRTLYVIADRETGEPYIRREYLYAEARAERHELLAPYPPRHAWRRRLVVQPFSAPSERR